MISLPNFDLSLIVFGMFFGLFVTASLEPRCQILGIARDDALRGVMIVFVSCSISHGAVVDTTAVRSLLVAALRLMPYLVPLVSQLPRMVRFDCAFPIIAFCAWSAIPVSARAT